MTHRGAGSARFWTQPLLAALSARHALALALGALAASRLSGVGAAFDDQELSSPGGLLLLEAARLDRAPLQAALGEAGLIVLAGALALFVAGYWLYRAAGEPAAQARAPAGRRGGFWAYSVIALLAGLVDLGGLAGALALGTWRARAASDGLAPDMLLLPLALLTVLTLPTCLLELARLGAAGGTGLGAALTGAARALFREPVTLLARFGLLGLVGLGSAPVSALLLAGELGALPAFVGVGLAQLVLAGRTALEAATLRAAGLRLGEVAAS